MSSVSQNSNRTSWSLIISTLLHGSVITLVALGPAYLPSFYSLNHGPKNASEQIDIETINVESTPSTLSDIKSVAVQPPPAAVAPTVTAPAVAMPLAPKATPTPSGLVVKKRKTFVENFKKESMALPEKASAEIEPQPPIAVGDLEQDSVVVSAPPPPQAAEAEDVVASTTPAPQEVTPAPQEVVTPAPPAPVVAVAEEEALPSQNISSSSDSATNASAAQEAATSAPSTEAASAAPITVTQSYLELKQIPGNRPPVYPRELRLKKEQGSGQLVYYVTRDGQVSDLRLTKSTGSPKLDQAAVAAFSKYKFIPGQEGYTVHNFEFSLRGPETTEAGRLRTSMNH